MFRNYILEMHIGGRLTTKLAGEMARHLMLGLYGRLYSQLDPVRLGEVYRTMLVASDYGDRLARVGGNVNEETVGTLVGRYPAHDFVIDFEEAKSLFSKVVEPSAKQIELAGVLEERFPEIGHLLVVGWADELSDDDVHEDEEEDELSAEDHDTGRRKRGNHADPKATGATVRGAPDGPAGVDARPDTQRASDPASRKKDAAPADKSSGSAGADSLPAGREADALELGRSLPSSTGV